MSFDAYSAEVAAIVRSEMAYQGKSQADLIRYVELSQPSVSRRLRGHVAFSPAELARVASFLGKEITDLLPKGVAAPPSAKPHRRLLPAHADTASVLGVDRGRSHGQYDPAPLNRATGRCSHTDPSTDQPRIQP